MARKTKSLEDRKNGRACDIVNQIMLIMGRREWKWARVIFDGQRAVVTMSFNGRQKEVMAPWFPCFGELVDAFRKRAGLPLRKKKQEERGVIRVGRNGQQRQFCIEINPPEKDGHEEVHITPIAA